MTNLKNFPIVISGPSGGGKTQLVEYVEKRNPEFVEAFGCTSRERRPNEITAMYFISRSEFENMIKNNAFIEYTEYNGNYYGVPKSELHKLGEKSLLFNVGFSSAKIIKDLDVRSKLIYLLPPRKEELLKRLEVRGSDAKERYLLGIEETINHAIEYEYLLLSHQDNMEEIYSDFMDIVTQKESSNERRLILAKNRDFVRNYYK